MGADSKIQWCHHTFNPWEGCTKVSPGCLHCYAETRNQRWHAGANWGKGAPRRRTSGHNWNDPKRWQRAHLEACEIAAVLKQPQPERPRVFCASLADWLDDEVPIEWLADLLMLVRECSELDWLLLSKRPENWRARLTAALAHLRSFPFSREIDFGQADTADWVERWLAALPPDNVWLGTTVEDQKRADDRIPELVFTPARIRFLSMEPMLEPIDISGHIHVLGTYMVQWVIIGGESGPGAREFNTEAAWDLIYQCREGGVAPFVKQLGANPVTTNVNAMDWPEGIVFEPAGEGAASARVKLKDKKGGDMAEFPAELRVREFPAAR